jgi:DNA-binding Lrp family transcriptional regulator
VDDLDHQLIGLLRQNSRLPVASLAAATGVSRATVKARIDRLVENGTIEAFTIRLGAELRQAEVRAIVLIDVEG